MIYQNGKYPVKEICFHTTATSKGWMHAFSVDEKMAEIRRWHQGLGWKREGYHYLIDRNGSVASGRPEDMVGAGVKGRNRGVIHISLVGGRGASADDKFEDHYTNNQELALRSLVRDIMTRTTITSIVGHNQFANKGCPGFQVVQHEWLPVEKKVPSNFWASIISAILSMFGSKK